MHLPCKLHDNVVIPLQVLSKMITPQIFNPPEPPWCIPTDSKSLFAVQSAGENLNFRLFWRFLWGNISFSYRWPFLTWFIHYFSMADCTALAFFKIPFLLEIISHNSWMITKEHIFVGLDLVKMCLQFNFRKFWTSFHHMLKKQHPCSTTWTWTSE